MFNFLNKINKQEIITVSLIYGVFLVIGIISFADYGISVDEWELRELGFSNLKYLMGIFFENKANNLNYILEIPELSDHLGTHGAIFAMPMAYIEYIFNITDSKIYYLVRHYFNHLIFLVSTFYLYKLIKLRFNNWIYGLFGILFLFLTPRIFAESFYNHKDLIFLSLFVINLYYGVKFLNNITLPNASLFALTTALSIDIRIMGIIIIPTIIIPLLIKNLKNIKKIIYPHLTLYFFLLTLFTILFWPYLWENPLINFLKVFQSLSAFPHTGYNFYLGKYILASYLPWHYVPVWILISTPPLYLFLFFFGIIPFAAKILRQKNYIEIFNNNLFTEDLIYFILILFPIILVIVLNSTLYNGWRHLFFIYPCIIIFSIKGLHFIKINLFKNKKWVCEITTALLLIPISISMLKMHPHQNVYFNFIAGSDIEKKFEMDYWGLSNKQAFEIILKKDNKKIIKIGSAGPISLENSKKILENKSRERISITANAEADYVIDNYINWHGKYKKERHQIPKNFKKFDEIIVNKIKILTIYKKNNK